MIAIYGSTTTLDGSSAPNSAALSLMSTDTETLCTNIARLDAIIASPVEIALGFFLLERQAGVACVTPVAVVMYSTLLGTRVAAKVINKLGIKLCKKECPLLLLF